MLFRWSNCAANVDAPTQAVGRFESTVDPSDDVIEIAAADPPQEKDKIWPSNAGLGSLMVHIPEIAPVV